MVKNPFIACLVIAPVYLFQLLTFSQGPGGKRTLIINGKTTQVPVILVNDHDYVGLEALASAVNGSLSYAGNAIRQLTPVNRAQRRARGIGRK